VAQFGAALAEAEGTLVPAMFVAVTETLYTTSRVSPSIVHEVAVVLVHVRVTWLTALADAR
jgi:hypothetical protein